MPEYTIDGERARIADEEARSGRADRIGSRGSSHLYLPYFHGCTASRNGTTTENSNIRVCAHPSAVFHTAHVKKIGSSMSSNRTEGREGRVLLFSLQVYRCVNFMLRDVIDNIRIFIYINVKIKG